MSYIERFKCLQNVFIDMVRDNTVRLSDEELSALKNYRDSEFTGYVPLGFAVGNLIEENED